MMPASRVISAYTAKVLSEDHAAVTTRAALPFWLLIVIIGIISVFPWGGHSPWPLPQARHRRPISAANLRPVDGALSALDGVGAPLSGGLIDKFGAGRIVVACLLTTIAGLGLMYAATSANMLIASGVLMGIGVSGTGVTSLVGTIGRLAPPEKRLSAIASIGMAAGIGGFVALPVMHLLIETAGWQGSLLWLTAIIVLLIPLAWPIGGKPAPLADGVRIQSVTEALGEGCAIAAIGLTAGFSSCGFHVRSSWASAGLHRGSGLPTWVALTRCRRSASPISSAPILPASRADISTSASAERVIYFGRAMLFFGFLLLPITLHGNHHLRAAGFCGRHHPADQRSRCDLLRHHWMSMAVRQSSSVTSDRRVSSACGWAGGSST